MKSKLKIGYLVWGLAFSLMIVFTASPSVLAQDDVEDGKWRFEITPYFFASGLSGDTGVGRVTGEVDMSFSDILENLDIGFMASVEARKGPWIVSFDGLYFRLAGEQTKSWQGPLGKVSLRGALEATMTQQMYQLSAGYRLHDERTKLDLVGGVRYTRLDIDLKLAITTSGILFPGGVRSMSGTEDWFDPFVGFRVIAPFSEKWSFVGYGDLGGFTVGSDFTYQVIAGVRWQITKLVSAKFMYRYLYQDYKKDDFVWEMTAQGPMIGFGFSF